MHVPQLPLVNVSSPVPFSMSQSCFAPSFTHVFSYGAYPSLQVFTMHVPHSPLVNVSSPVPFSMSQGWVAVHSDHSPKSHGGSISNVCLPAVPSDVLQSFVAPEAVHVSVSSSIAKFVWQRQYPLLFIVMS